MKYQIKNISTFSAILVGQENGGWLDTDQARGAKKYLEYYIIFPTFVPFLLVYRAILVTLSCSVAFHLILAPFPDLQVLDGAFPFFRNTLEVLGLPTFLMLVVCESTAA